MKIAKINAAKGALMGSFMGDAAGAPLEFHPWITKRAVKNALLFQGGGVLRVGPGQVTDDSEMAISLANGLFESRDRSLNINEITRWYAKWIQSSPFDIGIAT